MAQWEIVSFAQIIGLHFEIIVVPMGILSLVLLVMFQFISSMVEKDDHIEDSLTPEGSQVILFNSGLKENVCWECSS